MTTTRKRTATIRAREYLRVSKDDSGRARSTEEQHEDNQRAADELAWKLGKPYEDVDRSASRYATRAREGFDRLMSDLERGRFGADVLVLWEGSRGSRDTDEWVALMKQCQRHGLLIHVTTHRRSYDPSNWRDRRSLLEDAVDSEAESGKTSDRVKRAMAANANGGKPHGRIPYGYKRRYHAETRKLIAQEPHPTEAKNVRELFKRIRQGHSLRSISKDWEARGIVNGKGTPFSPAHLRSLAMNRAYNGEREWTPGRKGGHHRPGPDAQIVKGTWEPLVPKATFLAVNEILSAPERRTSRPGRGIHLLSMIARCAVCDGPLAVTLQRAAPEYVCHKKSCVRVDKTELDTYAEKAMLAYLSREDLHTELSVRQDEDDQALTAARAAVKEIQAELRELEDEVKAGRLTAAFAGRVEPGINARLTVAKAHEKELETPNRLQELIATGKGARRDWKAAPMSTRREVARMLFSADVLGPLRVKRSTPGHRVPLAQRIEDPTQ
jgi:DNA invertase Pin-like site-specific DNA recombinase